jgi:hypothetical protein
MAVVRWSRRRFSRRPFVVAFAALAALNIVSFFNMWPAAIARFQTEIAFGLQAALVLGGLLLVVVVTASVIGLNVGLAHRWLPTSTPTTGASTLAAGLGLGAILAGLESLLSRLAPHAAPTWADFAGASAFVPTLAVLVSPIGSWITLTALLLVFVAALHAGTDGWTRRRVVFSLAGLAVGLVLAGLGAVESPLRWLAGGLVAGAALLAAYVFVLRHDTALLPLTTASMVALSTLEAGLRGGFPGALTGAVLGALSLIALGYLWSRSLTTGEPPPPTA